MKKFTLLMVALLVAVVTMAVPMAGTYMVGTGQVAPNYALLSAAVADINTNGVGGDIVLQITSDITETANVGLGVNTNGFGITIRPDADVDRTITFSSTTDNTGPSGHFVIGNPTPLVAWTDATTIGTSNVTIDGFALNGSTKRLKFTNTNANISNARLITIVGACQNTLIKNCILTNLSTYPSGSSYPVCIVAVVRKGTAIEVAPTNLTIDNNNMTCTSSALGMGMRITNSGTITLKITGFVFKNNNVNVMRRLLEISYLDGVSNINNNTFNLNQSIVPGALVYGIYSNLGLLGTINVFNNNFAQANIVESSATGTLGLRLVQLASGPTMYNIYNNMFSGINRSSAVAGSSVNLGYINTGYGTSNIYNNTFYMPALTSPTNAGYYQSINNANNKAGTKIVNNIFISDEPSASFALISDVSTTTCNYNVLYSRQTNANAKYISTYTTFAAYQAANPTKDINSKNIDVNFVSATDLTLTGASINDPNLAVPRLSTVLIDIAGTSRATLTYTGAFEASNLSSIFKQFTVTAPNGTPHVYIAGDFTGKAWDNTTPFELMPTATANQFSGILPCVDGVAYKYLCEKGDWDYVEAVYDGSNAPLTGSNRVYAATDNVPIWFRVNKITLNTSFASGSAVPSQLFVKGSFNAWASGIAMTKTGNTYSTVLGGNAGDKLAANTEYKYYTNDMVADNWESDAIGAGISNRWSIAPVMSDIVARFTTVLVTKVDDVVIEARIARTASGIEVTVDSESTVELYGLNGVMLDKAIVNGTYSHDLNNGVYIIRINGKATKFIK